MFPVDVQCLPNRSSLSPNWTVKRIGKRLDRIWPHLEARVKARKDRGHGGTWTHPFRLDGGFGGFEGPISLKVPKLNYVRDF